MILTVLISRSTLDRERKASAYYHVAYSADTVRDTDASDDLASQRCLSFPWIWHELLCQIKHTKMAQSTAPSAHQSLERIGKALVDANNDISATADHFIFILPLKELQNMSLSQEKQLEYLGIIITLCESDDKFRSIDGSNESTNQRIAEQFLAMIDVLSQSREKAVIFQTLANIFLTKLHRIAITGSV